MYVCRLTEAMAWSTFLSPTVVLHIYTVREKSLYTPSPFYQIKKDIIALFKTYSIKNVWKAKRIWKNIT